MKGGVLWVGSELHYLFSLSSSFSISFDVCKEVRYVGFALVDPVDFFLVLGDMSFIRSWN